MKAIARGKERAQRAVAEARHRWPVVDHGLRTHERYAEAYGARLAAAIAYFGFFAIFAFGVVLYSVLGFLVEYHVDLREQVDQFLQENLPVIDSDQIAAGRGAAGVIALIGLVVTGLGWVETLRSSQRRIWHLEQAPGSAIVRRLVDLVALVGLALLLGLSFAVVTGIEAVVAAWAQPVAWIIRPIGWVLLAGVNLVLAVALLSVLPRIRAPLRRLLPPAVAVAVALVILNTLGQAYVRGVQENPAYSVVATAAGLLVYLYLVHQIVLYAAAWAATDRPPPAS
ncbi:YihY/virulence factor BrkB family protein [Natronosporangium hydrolyticum]|uniref:YihY/virulence factor BrkB family protein n=1 Tax=Natronosporangium hydrolyticum TaxID=2811111 RepID=A0A895YLA9_9ACTN|nr:YhjD/YihY/BrkB family envelope integrity protein [Natronosporangium hydrolyticum]QSB15456.1 YihY/virulence factor BrkB family protein [Natronosporangium hydrolyticum]